MSACETSRPRWRHRFAQPQGLNPRRGRRRSLGRGPRSSTDSAPRAAWPVVEVGNQQARSTHSSVPFHPPSMITPGPINGLRNGAIGAAKARGARGCANVELGDVPGRTFFGAVARRSLPRPSREPVKNEYACRTLHPASRPSGVRTGPAHPRYDLLPAPTVRPAGLSSTVAE